MGGLRWFEGGVTIMRSRAPRPPKLLLPGEANKEEKPEEPPPQGPRRRALFGSNRFALACVVAADGTEGVLKSVRENASPESKERGRARIHHEREAYRRVEEIFPGALPRRLPELEEEEDGAGPSLVVERMGLDLCDTLQRGSLPSPEVARLVLLRLAWILSRLHRAGVTHNDLKPENVVQGRDGELSSVYLIDLESVRYREEDCDGEGRYVTTLDEKTPGYAAPESWRGERLSSEACWGAQDAFALGRIAHALLTGESLGVRPGADDQWVDWAAYSRELAEQARFSPESMRGVADMMPGCLAEALRDLEPRVTDPRLWRITQGLLDPRPETRMTCAEAHAVLCAPTSKKRKRPPEIETPRRGGEID